MTTDTKYDNEQAIEIIEREGLGYAVEDYCRGDRFSDPETAKLWTGAREALRSLCDYLEESTGHEIDG